MNKIANFIILTVSLLVSLLAAEFVIRIVSPQQLILLRPDVWCPAPLLGWKHCPNASSKINSGEGEVTFTAGPDGYRTNPNRKQNVNESSYKLLVLGDSFMEAIQVEDNETTAEELASLIEKKKSVFVSNRGVGQWDPNHYLIVAKEEVNPNEFDQALVFIYLGNDIVEKRTDSFPPRNPTLRHQVQMPNAVSWQLFIDNVLYPVNDFLETRSHLFNLFKKSVSVLLMKTGLSGQSLSPIYFKNRANDPMWSVTESIIQDISNEFARKNIPVLFVFIPSSYQLDKAEFEKLIDGFGIDKNEINLEEPNQILGEKLKKLNIAYYDSLPDFKKSYQDGKKLYGNVDNHLNKLGHQVLAEKIISILNP